MFYIRVYIGKSRTRFPSKKLNSVVLNGSDIAGGILVSQGGSSFKVGI